MNKRKLKVTFHYIKLYFKDDFTYDVKEFLKYFNLKEHITFLYRRIKNVFYFLPIIWKDYWFDECYLLILIKHKLEQMEYNFIKNGMTESAGDMAKEMREVIDDLDILLNNKIDEEEYNLYYEKYPLDNPNIVKNRKIIKWFNRSQKQSEEQRAFYKEMVNRIDQRNIDLRLKIFNTIGSKSPSWWD